MSVSQKDVISRLEMRYDFLSSRSIFLDWSKIHGEVDTLDSDAMKSLIAYITEMDEHSGKAITALEKLSAPAEKGAPVEKTVSKEKAPAEEAPAEKA